MTRFTRVTVKTWLKTGLQSGVNTSETWDVYKSSDLRYSTQRESWNLSASKQAATSVRTASVFPFRVWSRTISYLQVDLEANIWWQRPSIIWRWRASFGRTIWWIRWDLSCIGSCKVSALKTKYRRSSANNLNSVFKERQLHSNSA